MSVAESVIGEIMSHMPPETTKYLVPLGGDGFTLCVHWKLRNDPARPNKYSKTIAISIPSELIEDFPGYPNHMQEAALKKIGASIKARLAAHDPEHNSPRGFPEPVEKWSVSIENLFG